jgi:hyperosmotically inducible protein
MDKGFNALYKKITTQVLFGRVFLLGYVSSQEEIDEAVHIASDTEGVIDVINELKVSDKSNYFDTKQYLIDSYITSAVKTKLFGTKDLKSFTFTVITQNNIVYLFGNVDSQEKLEEITSIVSYISGVHKVKSYIIIN